MKKNLLPIVLVVVMSMNLSGCNEKEKTVTSSVVSIEGTSIEESSETVADSEVITEDILKDWGELPRPDLACLKRSTHIDDTMVEVMNLNLRYLLDTWWNGEKPEALISQTGIAMDVLNEEQISRIEESRYYFENWQKFDSLYLAIHSNRSYTENSIRPLSHVCAIVSAGILGDYYDEKIVGITKEDARQMTLKLISSAANAYVNDEWGHTWQSALWAENIGFAAWLLWPDLPQADKDAVEYMIMSEAEYILNEYQIPYYRDKDGNEICIGDTKGEEIAWNTKILALAACLYPEHENKTLWEEKMAKMLIAATATPEDLSSCEIIDGVIPSDFLGGTNVHSDGTVINHGLYHIDYMTTIIEEMTQVTLIYQIAGKEVPQSASHNVALIYRALVEVDLGTYDSTKAGKHFYQRNEEGNVSPETDMPGVNDWGGHWYANYYLADVYALVLGLDEALPTELKAGRWASQHLAVISQMVQRNAEGYFFEEGENNFVSGEMFQMHNLVRAYMLLNLLK